MGSCKGGGWGGGGAHMSGDLTAISFPRWGIFDRSIDFHMTVS